MQRQRQADDAEQDVKLRRRNDDAAKHEHVKVEPDVAVGRTGKLGRKVAEDQEQTDGDQDGSDHCLHRTARLQRLEQDDIHEPAEGENTEQDCRDQQRVQPRGDITLAAMPAIASKVPCAK